MSEELDMYPTNARLKPLTDFLLCNFEMFQQQCYPCLFNRLLILLWNQMNKVTKNREIFFNLQVWKIFAFFFKKFLEIFMNIDKTKHQKVTATKCLQMIEVRLSYPSGWTVWYEL